MAAIKEFPMRVYGPGDESEIINSWDELPDGYLTFAQKFWGEEVPKKGKPKAKPKAKKADDARRVELTAFLDEHSVDYVADIPLEDLEALSVKLTEHLEAQANGAGQ